MEDFTALRSLRDIYSAIIDRYHLRLTFLLNFLAYYIILQLCHLGSNILGIILRQHVFFY